MILPFTTYLQYEAIYFYYMWHQWKSSHKSQALLKVDIFFSFPSFTVKRDVCVIHGKQEDEMVPDACLTAA